ncbi:MAG TPA: serine/threonine-protein kinase [Polyangia bacterium]|nr:serine/threonine-protein kinase [Polyangia bacterium]
MRRVIGIGLLGGAVALGLAAQHARAGARAEGEARTRAAEASAVETAQRLEAEARAVEARAARAAAIEPLAAAVANHVDGTTLLDLFEHEDWWQPFRDELAGARVIVGDVLVASWGKLDFGTSDAPVVRAARDKRLASTRVTIGGHDYVLAAARLPVLPQREPVVVLARRAAAASAAEVAPARAPSLLEGSLPLPVAGVLGLVGLALVATGGRRREPGAAVATEIPREPTLRFGTPARPVAAADTGARAPIATGKGVSIPGSSRSAPARGSASREVARATPIEPDAVVEEAPRMDSGRTFGRYRLLERLGEGGMSEVFTAVAQGVEGFSRTFVLKRLRPELAREREAVAQFIDEARLQAGLVHSNIVPVFDFGMIGNGEYFMTQEYIAGRDVLRIMLRHQERSHGGLEPTVAYYFAHETLQALAYAHEVCDKEGHPMQLVHRDVSPGNLMVSLRGEVKLADFGIVKASRRVSRTQVGMVKGNANFMSPEQARGQEVDARSDLFSLATVLYYCLTGHLLYGGDNDLDVLYKAARGPTPEDLERIATLPEPAASILAKALSYEPADRFQSAGEFADQLAAFIGGGKTQAASLVQRLFGEELRRRAA